MGACHATENLESLMIDDEDEDHVPHKNIPESQDDEFAHSIRVRDAARRAFIIVDTDQRLRRAAVSASRPDRLTFDLGDMCYFWRDGVVGVLEWPLWCLKFVKATIMLTMVDDFSNNLLSNCHMSRSVIACPRGCARIPGPRSKCGSCE